MAIVILYHIELYIEVLDRILPHHISCCRRIIKVDGVKPTATTI